MPVVRVEPSVSALPAILGSSELKGGDHKLVDRIKSAVTQVDSPCADAAKLVKSLDHGKGDAGEALAARARHLQQELLCT